MAAPVNRPGSSRRVLWLAGALALLSAGSACALAVIYATRHQIDFDIYRMGAAHALGQHLYDVRLPRSLMGGSQGMHFTYPPFAALVFMPFAHMSIVAGQVTWAILNLCALTTITYVSIRAVKPQWSVRNSWVVAAIALLPVARLNPDAITFALGQVNFFVVLLIMLDLTPAIRWRSHSLPRGVLLGVAAAIKLTPLIFIPFLVLTRQFRAAMTALLAFMVCSLSAFILAPRSSWTYWSTELFDARRSGNLLYISDQNFHSLLERIAGAPPSPPFLWALTAVIAAAGLAVARFAYFTSSPMLGMLITAITGLMISPVSWAHHYVWIVPVLTWLILGDDRPRGGQYWAAGAAILFWAAPIWRVPDTQTGYGGPLTILAGNSFFLAVASFLVLVTVMLVVRSRAHGGATRLQTDVASL